MTIENISLPTLNTLAAIPTTRRPKFAQDSNLPELPDQII